jgi:hypothetical protein
MAVVQIFFTVPTATPHPHGCLWCSPSSVDLDLDVPDVPVTWLGSLSGDSLAASHVSSSPLGQNPCEVCRMFGLLECLCLRQVSVPPGCMDVPALVFMGFVFAVTSTRQSHCILLQMPMVVLLHLFHGSPPFSHGRPSCQVHCQ